MTEKKCTKCKINYPITEFQRNRRKYLQSWCKNCDRICAKVRSKIYYAKNKERKRSYYLENQAKIRLYNVAYVKNRKEKDPIFRLSSNLRARLTMAIRHQGIEKHTSFAAAYGCSKTELKIHLESKFVPGMDWSNYSRTGWHVDHIIPLASAKTIEDLYKLSHFSNLQPLWATENLRKGKKF